MPGLTQHTAPEEFNSQTIEAGLRFEQYEYPRQINEAVKDMINTRDKMTILGTGIPSHLRQGVNWIGCKILEKEWYRLKLYTDPE